VIDPETLRGILQKELTRLCARAMVITTHTCPEDADFERAARTVDQTATDIMEAMTE
jgi:hypothetical protein